MFCRKRRNYRPGKSYPGFLGGKIKYNMATTIKDVANDAGVAVGTVSKVLNGHYVSAENKRKVEESVARLGYQMNYYARGLKTQYTYTVAVIVPDILNPFFACLVYHIEKELYKFNYRMFLCQSLHEAEKDSYYLRLARQNKVDGIMGITFNETELSLAGDIPIVMIDRHFKNRVCCVSSDNFRGGELAVERLTAGGSRKLLYIRSGSHLSSETLKRGDGFAAMCQKKNIPYDMIDSGDDLEQFNEQFIRNYFRKHIHNGIPDFDGIYTSTDGLALTVLKQLHQLNIRVPEDVQLIGHDGLRQMNRGDYLLSSIAQPIEDMARVGVENIIHLIRKEPAQEMTILPVKFVEGGTTRMVT